MATQPETLHIAMFPWFAFGHITPFLHLSNKFAARGHRVTFLIPPNAIPKVDQFNLHPNLLQFVPVDVPRVDGLPPNAQTTADVPHSLHPLIMTAMDETRDQLEASLDSLKPDFVFFDFAYWVPTVTRRLNIKSVHYCIVSAASVAYLLVPSRKLEKGQKFSSSELMSPPKGFPQSALRLPTHIAEKLAASSREYGSGVSFHDRLMISMEDPEAIAFRTCNEIEAPYCEFIETQYKKPVLLSGPISPEPPTSLLEERWDKWLNGFPPSSVVFCSLGSECILPKDLFQELVLGLDMTTAPFFVALKPPTGATSVEEALPDGFAERVLGKGVVHGGWVQQQLLLAHPSVGCFVSHCGFGSVWEAAFSDCLAVTLPMTGEQFLNAKMLCGDLKIGVEVERREEDGWFDRESVRKAVEAVMNAESQVGKVAKVKKAELKGWLCEKGLESRYIDGFLEKLKGMLHGTSSSVPREA